MPFLRHISQSMCSFQARTHYTETISIYSYKNELTYEYVYLPMETAQTKVYKIDRGQNYTEKTN